MCRHYGLEHRPEFIRDPVAGRYFIHGRPRALPFLRFCCCHAPQVTIELVIRIGSKLDFIHLQDL